MYSLKGVVVAKITKVFGLKGAVCLNALTDLKDRIYNTKEFYLDESCNSKIIVEKIEGDWNHLHVFFKDYDSIEKSNNLIGKNLFLPSIDSTVLENNQIFYHDLFNYKIEYIIDKFTQISDIYISNEMVYLSIILNKKEYIVPFNSDFIDQIDKINKIVKLKRFDLIEGNPVQ